MRAVINDQAVEMFCPFRPGKCFGRDCMTWEPVMPDHYNDPVSGPFLETKRVSPEDAAARGLVKVEGKGVCGMAGRR